MIIPTSQALGYSPGVKVRDIFTWEITEATDPEIIGLTMKIEITEIENTTTSWRIKYYLKDWHDYDYDGWIYSQTISKGGHLRIWLFCLLPVQEYLQIFVGTWGLGKSYALGNMFELTNTQQQYTYDIHTGVLLSYSSTGLDGFTYVLQGQSGSIPGYNLTMIIGLLGASIVVIGIQIKKKTRSLCQNKHKLL
ncbi:hypothetical protein LCGC14_2425010 [marine sediment metagenome]|uniref:Uncharacterized protein n=1 Tax=marine sediment metagenome TaxID=412755 RepID=A0A0F9BNK6_9ZZZZ